MARISGDSAGAFVLPKITFKSVCDIFINAGFVVRSMPADDDRVIRWCSILGKDLCGDDDVLPQEVLRFCDKESVVECIATASNAMIVFFYRGDALPENIDWGSNLVIHVDSEDGKDAADARQALRDGFLTLLGWESRLRLAVETKRPVNQLLNIGANFFKNFIYAYRIDLVVLGYSTDVDFPNEHYRRIIETSEHIDSDVIPFTFPSARDSARVKPQQVFDRWGNPCHVMPLYYRGALFGTLVMVRSCGLKSETGTDDLFSHFAQYVLDLVGTFWGSSFERDMPHYSFLTSLLEGETLPESVIEARLASAGVPKGVKFKTVAIDMSDVGKDPGVLDALKSLNEHRSMVAVHENHLVAVLYGREVNDPLSHRNTRKEVESFIAKPFRAACGVSQVFDDLRDVAWGYWQAILALKYRDAYRVEAENLYDEAYTGCVFFDSVLSYCLIAEEKLDASFKAFCFSSSLIEKIRQRDSSVRSNDFALLWHYLVSGCSATVVGRKYFMHRNSVLYRVRQIEKRFDFSLDDWACREKLILEYRLFILHNDESLVKRLLQDS